MADKVRVVIRHIVMLLCFWLPAARRKKIERWLRGREEFARLQRCDWVLMSWGKSGRTWLRVMLSRAYTLKGGFDASELLDFDNLKKRDASLPAVFFTHNNYLRDYTGNQHSKRHFQGKRIVLLVRDPRDVAVSQFFQWQYRMRPNKKFINDYPPHGANIDAWDFVLDKDAGVPRIVEITDHIEALLKALEIADEKEAVEQYGSADSGASLGDILGAALKGDS